MGLVTGIAFVISTILFQFYQYNDGGCAVFADCGRRSLPLSPPYLREAVTAPRSTATSKLDFTARISRRSGGRRCQACEICRSGQTPSLMSFPPVVILPKDRSQDDESVQRCALLDHLPGTAPPHAKARRCHLSLCFRDPPGQLSGVGDVFDVQVFLGFIDDVLDIPWRVKLVRSAPPRFPSLSPS